MKSWLKRASTPMCRMVCLPRLTRSKADRRKRERCRLLPGRHAARHHLRLPLAAKRQTHRLGHLLHVTMTDFSEPGELGVFIDEGQISSLEKKMFERGYLEGAEMAGTFNMLRANDLYLVLRGQQLPDGQGPFPSTCCTGTPTPPACRRRCTASICATCTWRTSWRELGGIEIDGTPIDLGKAKIPAYFISAIEDHIAPWKSTPPPAPATWRPGALRAWWLRATSPASSTARSEQIRLLVNPAAKLPESVDAWSEGAEQQGGSEGPTGELVSAHDADTVAARDPAKASSRPSKRHRLIQDADRQQAGSLSPTTQDT